MYDGIAVKTVTSTYPQVMFVNNTYPDIEMYVDPVPNTACEIANEFGVEPPQTVQRIAMTSKRNLKRINNPDDIMSIPYPLVVRQQRFNVYVGNY